MAVNNSCKSKYEREKTREALIELIDVVQTMNDGKPYTDRYFETATQKLEQRDREEEEAGKRFLSEELKQWRDELKTSEENSNSILDKQWNRIQLDILEKELQTDFKNVVTAIVDNFKVLIKGISTLLQLMEVDDDNSLGAVLNGIHEAAGYRLRSLKAEDERKSPGIFPFGRPQVDQNEREVIEEKSNSPEKIMAEKRMELIKLLREKGANRQECALVLGYATQVSSLIAENYLETKKLKQLKEDRNNNYANVAREVTKELKHYLKMMKEQHEVMLNYNREDAGSVYSPIQMIVQEAVFTIAPAVMTRLQDGDEKGSYKNLRVEWRKKYIKMIEERGTLTDELKMTYGRHMAVNIAEKSTDIQKNVKVTGASEPDKLYYKRIKKGLKTALENAKHGKETLDFLFKRDIEDKLAEKAVIESVTAATEIDASSRRKYRFSESLKVLGEASDIEAIEVGKTYTSQAAEFLAERQLNYSRLQEIQKEQEIEAQNGRMNIGRITEKFSIFQKFIVADENLGVVGRIAEQFAKLHVSNLMLELEDDLEKKENIKLENENLKRRWKKVETDYETKITDLATYLTSRIRDKARTYARKRDKDQLEEMQNDDFESASNTLSEEVKEVLSEEVKKYFEHERIAVAIKTYARLNHKILMNLAQEVKKCFPSEVTVVEEKRGEIKISDARVGDKILTVSQDGKRIYEEVFMFAHAVDTYLELYSEAGPSVPLSRNHLLHVGCQGKLKAAKEVTIGDTIFVMSDGKLQETKITEIVEVTKRGAYCPYTTGGSLVVNNILASCYTDVISHQVAHVMLFPIRLLYFLLPSRVFNWLFWYDEKVGMPKLLLNVKNFYQWMWGNQRV